MYYKSKDQLFLFLSDFLDFNEFKAILPKFFVRVYKHALDMLLEKAIPYLEGKNVNKEETEFFSVVLATECFLKVLENYTGDGINYSRLAFLVEDTNKVIELNYPEVIKEMPSYTNNYQNIIDLLCIKQKDIV